MKRKLILFILAVITSLSIGVATVRSIAPDGADTAPNIACQCSGTDGNSWGG